MAIPRLSLACVHTPLLSGFEAALAGFDDSSTILINLKNMGIQFIQPKFVLKPSPGPVLASSACMCKTGLGSLDLDSPS